MQEITRRVWQRLTQRDNPVCVRQRGLYGTSLETQQSASGPAEGCDCFDLAQLLSDKSINTSAGENEVTGTRVKLNTQPRCVLSLCDPALADTQQRRGPKEDERRLGSTVFRLFVDGEDTCTLDPLQLHTLTSCGFNGSNPLIIITHGWSVRSSPALFTLHCLEPLHTKHST